MVQVHQFGVAHQRAGKHSESQLILVANSNAISGVGGSSFAVMPVEVKKIFGIKKALNG
ncbi:hypothetical protein [Lactobacillus crispatus]|uniref:hypothetical protein n=1 Tax=Lactobacillus crispatus TaxID=47770 RepID=UPI00141517F8|nr:hypothetical protein [Lactobacillus crispatus]